MTIRRFTVVAAMVAMVVASRSDAAEEMYMLNMTGAQENNGDPDGLATGTIALNDATGVVSWNFNYSNIAAPSLMVIHGPGGSAGNSADAFVFLNVSTSGGAGTLIGSVNHSRPADIVSILNDPTEFYVNIHNSQHGNGAVRGQLGTLIPEPSALLLAVLGVLGMLGLARRRRRRTA